MNDDYNFIALLTVVSIIMTIVYIANSSIQEPSTIKSEDNIDAGHLNKQSGKLEMKLIDNLYDSYLKAKRNAFRMLWLAFFSLFIGSILFYYASSIPLDKRTKQEENDKKEIRNMVNDYYLEKFVIEEKIPLDSISQVLSSYKPSYDEDGNPKDEKLATSMDSLQNYRNNIGELVKRKYAMEMFEKRNRLFKDTFNSSSNSNLDSLSFLLFTISVRLIIAFITFYLAQLFIRLYRYYLQVSDFYLNRCDAIIAFTEKKYELGLLELTEIFQHKFDMGVGPKNPIDTAIKIINSMGAINKNSK